MEQNTEELLNLLQKITEKECFELKSTKGSVLKFKPLTTKQLKLLLQNVVDTSAIQSSFTLAASQIFEECLINKPQQCNVIDRLCFLLEARSKSLPNNVLKVDGEEINFDSIKNIFFEKLQQNKEILENKTTTTESLEIVYGIPTIQADIETLELQELHKKTEELKESNGAIGVVGILFVLELTKTIKQIKAEDKTYEFSLIPLNERLKLIENLPAICIGDIVNYIQNYKQLTEYSMVTANGKLIVVNASLFATY